MESLAATDFISYPSFKITLTVRGAPYLTLIESVSTPFRFIFPAALSMLAFTAKNISSDGIVTVISLHIPLIDHPPSERNSTLSMSPSNFNSPSL